MITAPLSRTLSRFRLKRLAVTAATILTAAVFASTLGISPALATSSANGLPAAISDDASCSSESGMNYGGYLGVICIQLGLYTSSTGQKYIVGQVSAWCVLLNTEDYVECSNVHVDATVADASYNDFTVKNCGHSNGACQSSGGSTPQAENWFFPFGGIAISEGQCANNVWAVVNGENDDTSYITLPVSGKNVYVDGNFEDGHYSQVCLDSNGDLVATE